MTPQEVGAFIAAHGGPAGGDGPDANGIITQRAKDGSTITIRQTSPGQLEEVIRNEARPASATASTDAPTAATTPAVAPTQPAAAPTGGPMDQQQLQAYLQQFSGGNAASLVFTQEQKTEEIPNPRRYQADGTVNVLEPPTIKGPVWYGTWVKPGTNQRLTMKMGADGTYERAFEGADDTIKPPAGTNRTSEQQTVDAAAAAKAQQDQKESEANAALPKDQDPAYETNAARRARADARIAQQRQAAIDEEARKRQTETDARAAAQANEPKVTLTQDGTQAVITYPDGRVETKPTGLTKPPTPGSIVKGGGANGEDVQAVADPKTGQIHYEPIPGAPKPPTVDLPALKMEAGKVSQEVIDRWNELNQKVKAGEITKEQAIKEFEPIHAAAETRLTEIKSVFDEQNSLYSSAQSQRGQDLRDIESRRTAATSAAGDAAAYGRTVLGKPGLGNADLAAAEDYVVQRALRAQTSFGGDRQVPQAQPGPALQQANTLGLPGMPTAAGLGDAAPSATGGMVPAPAAPTPAQTPEQAAAARLVNPAFRPAPPTNVQSQPASEVSAPALSPTPAAVGSTPIAPTPSRLPPADEFGRMPASGGATATPPDYWHPDVGTSPPYNDDPSQGPVGPTPTPAEHHAASGGSPAFTPSTSSGGGSGSPILSLDIPGVGPLKIFSPGQGQPSAPTGGTPALASPKDDPNDMLKRLRRIGGNDPSWMQANDSLSQQYSGVA